MYLFSAVYLPTTVFNEYCFVVNYETGPRAHDTICVRNLADYESSPVAMVTFSTIMIMPDIKVA